MQMLATKRFEKLQWATDQHVGLEILHAFVLDVLGRDTVVARIFENSVGESFEETQVGGWVGSNVW